MWECKHMRARTDTHRCAHTLYPRVIHWPWQNRGGKQYLKQLFMCSMISLSSRVWSLASRAPIDADGRKRGKKIHLKLSCCSADRTSGIFFRFVWFVAADFFSLPQTKLSRTEGHPVCHHSGDNWLLLLFACRCELSFYICSNYWMLHFKLNCQV